MLHQIDIVLTKECFLRQHSRITGRSSCAQRNQYVAIVLGRDGCAYCQSFSDYRPAVLLEKANGTTAEGVTGIPNPPTSSKVAGKGNP